jgi:hypothetical protein
LLLDIIHNNLGNYYKIGIVVYNLVIRSNHCFSGESCLFSWSIWTHEVGHQQVVQHVLLETTRI